MLLYNNIRWNHANKPGAKLGLKKILISKCTPSLSPAFELGLPCAAGKMCITCGGMRASGSYGPRMFETMVILERPVAALILCSRGKKRWCHLLTDLKQLGQVPIDNLNTVFSSDRLM